MTPRTLLLFFVKTLSRMASPETKKAWIKSFLRSKKRMHLFGQFFFPHIIKTEPPPIHLELLRCLSERKDGAIIFPRGFGKSTWEKIDTIHDIVNGLEPVILYVGATVRDAQFHFESIKGELENNEMLRAVYGNLVPDPADLGRKWTNTHFETTNKINVVARGGGKGRGVNIRNQRPTKIILDDIEDDESVQTAEGRAKLNTWINGVIMPSKDRERGFVKMIGTVLHPQASLLAFYATHGGMKRAAIEDGASVWPTYWTMEKLEEERRAIGSLLFNQEYMNIPMTAAGRLVRESWIKRVPMPLSHRSDEAGNKVKIVDAYGAVDPAISEKETADYTAVGTVWRNVETGKITVVDIERGHLAFQDQVAMMLRKHRVFEYLTLGVEAVAYQKVLRQEIDRQGPIAGVYPPTQGIVVDKDKVRRFLQVLPLIENGTIEFADTLPPEFFDELISFPNGQHDDMVDAFVHAATLAMEGSTQGFIAL